LKVSWEENWQLCCSIGMKPIVLETSEEQICLQNLTRGASSTNLLYVDLTILINNLLIKMVGNITSIFGLAVHSKEVKASGHGVESKLVLACPMT
jgi:hypothetical protein